MDIQNALNKKKSEFDARYAVYLLQLEQENNPDWLAVRETIINSGRIPVSELYQLRRYELDHQKNMEELYHELLGIYLEFLSASGKLTTERNYFEE